MSRFSQILASLSETEAQAVYNALAQWADNERNGLDEETPADQVAAVEAVQGVVERLEAELVRGA